MAPALMFGTYPYVATHPLSIFTASLISSQYPTVLLFPQKKKNECPENQEMSVDL